MRSSFLDFDKVANRSINSPSFTKGRQNYQQRADWLVILNVTGDIPDKRE